MKFNALKIDFYLRNGIRTDGYNAGKQTGALLKELALILDQLEPYDYGPNLHSIWVNAKRPTLRQYYEEYYQDIPYEKVDCETLKNIRKEYSSAYPTPDVWYLMTTNHFQFDGQELYLLGFDFADAFFINDNTVTRTDREDTELLQWAIEKAKTFVSAVKNDNYQSEILSKISYPYLKGEIKRKTLWAICKNMRHQFFKPVKKRDIEKYKKVYNESGKNGIEPLKEMTARIFYEACATVYNALGIHGVSSFRYSNSECNRYEKNIIPKEIYYAITDNDDLSLESVSMDDEVTFKEQNEKIKPLYSKCSPANPWSFMTKIDETYNSELFLFTEENNGRWYFKLSGTQSTYKIVAANALYDAGYPVLIEWHNILNEMLSGDDDVEIVPIREKESPPYSIHLPLSNKGKDLAEIVTWYYDHYELKEENE